MDTIVERVLDLEKLLLSAGSGLEAVVQRAQVAAGAEGLFARAAQHHHAHAIVRLPVVEASGQVLQHSKRDRVERRGTVQLNGGHPIAHLDLERGQSFFHSGLRFPRKALTPSAWSAWSKRSMKRSRSSARPARRGMPLRALWMRALQYSTARGESVATLSAIAVAASRDFPFGTTSWTNPMRSAVAASTRSLVRMMRLAQPSPTSHGSICVPLPAGSKPTPGSGRPICACSPRMRMSQASGHPGPPPLANPLI